MNSTKRILNDIKNYTNSDLKDNGIFCEFSENNIYNVKVLIIGNNDTPYEKGYYLFNLTFPPDYPFNPPKVNYCTQGNNIRFNPNLYTNGKVCVSILNTWDGPGWTAVCSLNSVLLSLQSLLNENPIQNEPGWGAMGIDDTRAKQYNEVIKYSNLYIAVLKNIIQPPEGFECFKPIMKELFIKNKDFFLDYIETTKSIDNSLLRSQIYGLFIKVNYNFCIKQYNLLVPKVKISKRKAPNKNSNLFEVDYEQISENDDKLYVVSLTKTNKKRWKLKNNNKIEI